ncbi:DinB family protein [Spirosoma soli]|uniref:DinB family protein n=1 Tax=Spirosoma soli TaxID=1770529 RepID=A0ABW5M6T9_9BACT
MPPIETREVWLRGPLPDMPLLVQPVAHALMQAREEVDALLHDFPEALLWERPAGVASVGFHLQHLTGVLDRLFTYARGQALSPEQLAALASEGKRGDHPLSVAELVHRFREQVERALSQLKDTDEQTLTEPRGVGRAQLPSTVIGLLVHAAEHTTRHLGQLLVTARVIRDQHTGSPLELGY